jgi:hypothetical protein
MRERHEKRAIWEVFTRAAGRSVGDHQIVQSRPKNQKNVERFIDYVSVLTKSPRPRGAIDVEQ